HTPVQQRLKELCSSRPIGEVMAIHADVTFAKGFPGGATLGRPRTEERHPKHFETIDSKREFYNVGVYPLGQIPAILPARALRVYAAMGNYFFAEHQKNNMEDF